MATAFALPTPSTPPLAEVAPKLAAVLSDGIASIQAPAPEDIILPAPCDQMIAWLDAALEHGPEAYIPFWHRMAESVGGHAQLIWPEEMWPELLFLFPGSRYARDAETKAQALREHLQANRMKWHLLRYPIGDSAGTYPEAEDEPVGSATLRVARDYLAAGGLIMIEPSGKLTTAGGVIGSYGLGSEAEDTSIENAVRAHTKATCCPRSASVLRRLVTTFGTKREDGWIVLEELKPTVGQAFAAWKEGILEINAGGQTDKASAWAIHDVGEQALYAMETQSPELARALLWVALNDQELDREGVIAAREDIAAVRSMWDTLSQEAFVIWRALEALQPPEHQESGLEALIAAYERAVETWATFYNGTYEPLEKRFWQARDAIPHTYAPPYASNGGPRVMSTADRHDVHMARSMLQKPDLVDHSPDYRIALETIRDAAEERENKALRIKSRMGLIKVEAEEDRLCRTRERALRAVAECSPASWAELGRKQAFFIEAEVANEEFAFHSISADITRLAGEVAHG